MFFLLKVIGSGNSLPLLVEVPAAQCSCVRPGRASSTSISLALHGGTRIQGGPSKCPARTSRTPGPPCEGGKGEKGEKLDQKKRKKPELAWMNCALLGKTMHFFFLVEHKLCHKRFNAMHSRMHLGSCLSVAMISLPKSP